MFVKHPCGLIGLEIMSLKTQKCTLQFPHYCLWTGSNTPVHVMTAWWVCDQRLSHTHAHTLSLPVISLSTKAPRLSQRDMTLDTHLCQPLAFPQQQRQVSHWPACTPTHTLALSLSLTHTHTHTHSHIQSKAGEMQDNACLSGLHSHSVFSPVFHGASFWKHILQTLEIKAGEDAAYAQLLWIQDPIQKS